MKKLKFKTKEIGTKIIDSIIDPLAEDGHINSQNIPFLIELFNNRKSEDGWKLHFEITQEDTFDGRQTHLYTK